MAMIDNPNRKSYDTMNSFKAQESIIIIHVTAILIGVFISIFPIQFKAPQGSKL